MRLGLKHEHVPGAASLHRLSGRLPCDRNKRQRRVSTGKQCQAHVIVDAGGAATRAHVIA